MFIILTGQRFFNNEAKEWQDYERADTEIRFNTDHIIRYSPLRNGNTTVFCTHIQTSNASNIFEVRESAKEIDAIIMSNNSPAVKVLYAKSK